MNRAFDRLSAWLSAQIGRPAAFILVCTASAMWLAAAMGTRHTEAINNWLGASTGVLSIIVLVLMQADDRRGRAALHGKLDELVRAIPEARNELIALEKLAVDEIEAALEQTARG